MPRPGSQLAGVARRPAKLAESSATLADALT
jgi:hypothetical protein